MIICIPSCFFMSKFGFCSFNARSNSAQILFIILCEYIMHVIKDWVAPSWEIYKH